MRKVFTPTVGILLLLTALQVSSFPALGQQRSVSPDTPKLVVILVVDQMRADYVDRFRGDWSSGLKRIFTKGAWFRNAAYPYLGTYTCAGHATIATGTFPHVHGVFQNAWYDRERAASMPCTDDPSAAPVAYTGRPGSFGPRLLEAQTLAEAMRAHQSTRVVSISLKARSAIMLAGHGGDVIWMNDTNDGWQTSTAFTGEPVPAVKAYLDGHPVSADYGKVWMKSLPAKRYREPDDGEAEAPRTGWTTTFPHALTDPTGAPGRQFFDLWQHSPFADEYVAQMAAALVKDLALGQRGTTDVLAVSFSSPDLVGHQYGPNSQETRDIYGRLDRSIGHLLDRLDASLGRNAYVVALSSDHGVTEIPEQRRRRGGDAGRLSATALRDAAQRVLESAWGPGDYVAGLATNDVYFRPGIDARLRGEPAVREALEKALVGQPGIQRVLRAEDVEGQVESTDPAVRAAALSYVRGRSGDLILILRPGWMFSSNGTTHGSATPDDQRVPLAFLGRGIRPGRYADAATPADLAPTLAALVGVPLPQAQGRVLSRALRGTPVDRRGTK
jgi:predicted AlkP superfamily pyrophosphatase or phosphodiesterase